MEECQLSPCRSSCLPARHTACSNPAASTGSGELGCGINCVPSGRDSLLLPGPHRGAPEPQALGFLPLNVLGGWGTVPFIKGGTAALPTSKPRRETMKGSWRPLQGKEAKNPRYPHTARKPSTHTGTGRDTACGGGLARGPRGTGGGPAEAQRVGSMGRGLLLGALEAAQADAHRISFSGSPPSGMRVWKTGQVPLSAAVSSSAWGP